MSSIETKPVLIAGAGPAGLIAALSLTKFGVPVRIVEKLPAFHTATRGTGTQPRSLEIYRFLGLLDDYLRVAKPLPTMRSYKLPGGIEPLKTWKVVEHPTPTPDRPLVGESRVVLGQYRLEGIFRDHLAKHGVSIELSTELVYFEQDVEGVTVTLKKNHVEEQARVAYVIGADGARGVTRKLMGATFEGQTREEDGHVWADVELEGLSPEFWHVWSEPGRFTVTIRATGDQDGHFHVGIIGKNFDPGYLTDEEKFVNFIYENTGRRDLQFKKFTSMNYWKPKMRMVNRLHSGRAFIVGDAAHIHSPTGGQGLNTSIQDSFNLAWKLALVHKGLASPELLASFEAERLPVIAEMLATTTALYEHAVADKRHDQSKEQVAADMLGPMFLQWRNTSLSQLDINYRWSPIVFEALGNGGLDDAALKARAYIGYPGQPVHAGDRAPDAPELVDEMGQTTQLHEIFQPTLHTFLLFLPETSRHDEEQVDSIIQTVRTLPEATFQIILVGRDNVSRSPDGTTAYKDTEGYAFGAYHVEGEQATVVAVRPDGYVGAFVYDAAGLRRYFSRIFLIA
ncbi:hypothetical protein BN946_scf184912.g45 [Trametes cinnabarina]|uniref:FAD-binding domain-containing protein n=1 Tax=Pycnoporus cinnabarinus TaxID=5643 RepID=A0A060STS0_PYCCI|nr:hypothetical protein BN946_scf184912.g45 [Trametes cinnabarina]